MDERLPVAFIRELTEALHALWELLRWRRYVNWVRAVPVEDSHPGLAGPL